jgi:hypothetical protein
VGIDAEYRRVVAEALEVDRFIIEDARHRKAWNRAGIHRLLDVAFELRQRRVDVGPGDAAGRSDLGRDDEHDACTEAGDHPIRHHRDCPGASRKGHGSSHAGSKNGQQRRSFRLFPDLDRPYKARRAAPFV